MLQNSEINQNSEIGRWVISLNISASASVCALDHYNRRRYHQEETVESFGNSRGMRISASQRGDRSDRAIEVERHEDVGDVDVKGDGVREAAP